MGPSGYRRACNIDSPGEGINEGDWRYLSVPRYDRHRARVLRPAMVLAGGQVAKIAQPGVAELLALNGREFSSGDKGSDAITLGDREQEVRWAVGVVMNGHLRRSGVRYMADSDKFEIVSGDIIVRTLDFNCQALSRF